MTGPVPPQHRRSGWRYLLLITAAWLLCILVGLWYLTTESFQRYVRRRVVAEVERITGGRAEIGSIHTVPFHMQIEVRDLTVHGREGAGEVPLAHADHIIAQLKVISLLRTKLGFYQVAISHPRVHIAFYSDGTTNVPSHPVPSYFNQNSVERLFALTINHFYVQGGELLWGESTFPLEIAVHDSELAMDYSFLRSRYESKLLLGRVETRFDDCRPFTWMSSAEFSVGSTFVDVTSLKLSSGRSHIAASGRISDFLHPQVTGIYDAVIDLAEVGSIARRHELREGVAEFKGQGKWSMDQFSTAGAVAVREFSWQDDQVGVRKASATADYAVTQGVISLSRLQAKAFGGAVTGDAQVDNWLHHVQFTESQRQAATQEANRAEQAVITAVHPRPARSQGVKPPELQSGVVHLRLRDVSDEEIGVALNRPAHPLRGFRPSGFTNGTVYARWIGSPENATISYALDLTPPQHTLAGTTPLTGHAQGSYQLATDALEVEQFNLSTPASRVQALGGLSKSSALKLSATTSNLEEWRPLIAALHGPTDLPFTVNGNAMFNGVIGGSLSSATLTGSLVAQDFDFTLPASSRTPLQQIHWDTLTTNAQLSANELWLRNGSLHRGETTADFELGVTLQNGEFTLESPFTAHVNLRGVDVASTAALAGLDAPITGKADVALQLSGTRAQPRAQGHIKAVDASAYGEAISQFEADLQIANGEVALSNIHAIHEDAVIAGSAAYNSSTRTCSLDLTGQNFDLSRVRQIHSNRISIQGRGDFKVQANGEIAAPEVHAAVNLRDVTLDDEFEGNLKIEGITKGGILHVTGQSQFPHGGLALYGNVQLKDNYPADISVGFDHLDLDPLWRAYLRGELTGHSSVAGTLSMKGPLLDPQKWNFGGSLTDVFLDIEHAKLHNPEAIRFGYSARTLHLEHVHMNGDGSDITAQGTVRFSGKREVDLSAEGRFDLKLLNAFDPDLTATGLVDMKLDVGGTLADPDFRGSLQLAKAGASYAGVPSGLSEMNGTVVFTRDHFHIQNLSAHTGGGTLELKGDATLYNGQFNFDLAASGKDVRLRYPPGVSSTANAELHWSGTRSNSSLSGRILVTKLAVTPNFDFSSYLERSRQITSITPPNSPLNNVKLDIQVQTSPELQMKTAVAHLSGDADLRLRGSIAHPTVLGRADILEGEASFNGTKFRLERGDITFANPVTIEPVVNLEASTHVRNYDLAITVTGTPDQPGGLRVNYRSEPPLPQSDIIALLALGRTSEESEQLQEQSGQTAYTQQASDIIINEAINSTVSSRVQKLFGASRIKIDPQGLTTETNPTARGPQVTIEQQFANNVSLTYSTNVSQSSQQIIQGEYFFTRNISAVGTRDQNGVVSFDLRIRRRKK